MADDDQDVRASLGTIAHSILLEGDESSVVVIDAPDYRTKDAKAARDNAWANGDHPILAHQLRDVRLMVEEARVFLDSAQLLKEWNDCAAEEAVFWQEGGTYCRGLLDKRGEHYIFDYKTTQNARPESWIRNQLVNNGYDVQAAWYMRGLAKVEAINPATSNFAFLVQEITEPYACSLIGLSPAMEALGTQKIEKALKLWRDCLASGQWPAYSHEIAWAEPLPWHTASFEERAAMDEMADEMLPGVAESLRD